MIISTDSFSRRAPSGLYVYKICEQCERLFSQWDDYGTNFFNKIIEHPSQTFKSKFGLANLYQNINYENLKMFLISLLWRSGISDDPFFENVILGKFEIQLRDRIIKYAPGTIDTFSVIISKYSLPDNQVLCPPHRVRIKGINGYKYYFFNSQVFIKVDSNKIKLRRIALLAKDQPLLVVVIDPPNIITEIHKAASKLNNEKK